MIQNILKKIELPQKMMKSIDKHKNDGKNIWAYCSMKMYKKI